MIELISLLGLGAQSILCAIGVLILYRIQAIEKDVRKLARETDEYRSKFDIMSGKIDVMERRVH